MLIHINDKYLFYNPSPLSPFCPYPQVFLYNNILLIIICCDSANNKVHNFTMNEHKKSHILSH